MSLQIFISSNATAILRQLVSLPSRMAQYIARAMDKENQITVGLIQREELSGPRPGKLGVITNRLRGSIRAIKAIVSGNSIESAIGSNVAYAGIHERGFTGTEKVRGFTRHNPRGDQRATQGAVVSLANGRIKKTKAAQSASGISIVRPFSRKVNVPARRYIEGTLERSTLAYSTAVSRAIESAWDGGGAAA